MILIGGYRSPYTRHIAVTLRLLGLAYEHRPISPWTDRDKVNPFNPLGRVPALVLDDDEVLIESSAILDCIFELAGPGQTLLPRSGASRRGVLQLMAIAQGALEKTIAGVYERTRRPADKQHQPWLELCDGQAVAALETLESRAGEKWLFGDAMTQADVMATVAYNFARLVNPDLAPDGRFPRLAALAARLNALPAFAETRPA